MGTDPPSPTVLLVEDDREPVALLRRLLEAAGCQVGRLAVSP